MARRNLLKSQIVKAWSKVEEQIAKEAEANLHKASGGDRKSKEYRENQGESNLTQVDSTKKRAPQTDEIMAKKAGFRSKNTWKDAKLIVAEGTIAKIPQVPIEDEKR